MSSFGKCPVRNKQSGNMTVPALTANRIYGTKAGMFPTNSGSDGDSLRSIVDLAMTEPYRKSWWMNLAMITYGKIQA